MGDESNVVGSLPTAAHLTHLLRSANRDVERAVLNTQRESRTVGREYGVESIYL